MRKPGTKTSDDAKSQPLADGGEAGGYDEWVKAKIEAAVAEADRHPEKRIPIGDVWKKFGLDD
ncbi:MAG: hypothetical protein PW791_12005 [Neorhizobium sp.]|jgi:hypothetical protein|nr:hypothetical protein [Neorhizobium sp.]